MRNSMLAGRTIGVIHADLANPFFTAVHSGIEEVATAAGCLILTGSSRDRVERQESLLVAFADRRVDGLIVVPAIDSATTQPGPERLHEEIRRGTPAVFVDRESTEPGDLVVSDNHGGARAATAHMIDHGHRDIAFLGDDTALYSAVHRLAGFRAAMAGAGLDATDVHTGLAGAPDAEVVVRHLLKRANPPTALFTAKNHITEGAVRVLHQFGLQRTIALVGFDEVPMGDVIEPGITVVAQDAPALGRLAGKLLLERINATRAEITNMVVPVRLIPRGSGEVRPSPVNTATLPRG